MANHSNLEKQVSELNHLVAALQTVETDQDKLALLDALPIVQNYLKEAEHIRTFIKSLTAEAEYAIKSIIAIGQGPIVFNIKTTEKNYISRLVQLLEQLLEIELFYRYMGGIIGYHLAVISAIVSQERHSPFSFDHMRYIHPEGLYIGKDEPEVHQAVRWGIENFQHLSLVYPLGGAGDRLNLRDEETGSPLPAACLPFLGHTLLEGLIRDLQALEYLYFKFFGRQVKTPVAVMTSVEKNNHIHILEICKKRNWFGRPYESFYFFIQPVVPVITIEGNWSLSEPLTLTLKPSGHGVLWKLAEEQGAFSWLEKHKRNHCLIRQINNPVAGTDNTILALIGIGFHENKTFGFASCERLLKSDEGTNVLIERETTSGFDYCLTNIEYTDFIRKGIQECPLKPASEFSSFPTNTNILFADIPMIRKILKTCPIPGQMINMKTKIPFMDAEGRKSVILGGRLESTMQNIADFIVDHFSRQLTSKECVNSLRSFIIYNDRSKTISTTKKSHKEGESLISTPEQACYDLLSNHYKLLKQCQFDLPKWKSLEDYLLHGPSCLLFFHPGLGPLYSIITQKIRKGQLSDGAELQLEIAEVEIQNLVLEGSLLIESRSPLGHLNNEGHLTYGKESRCILKNVTIKNQGINREQINHYWKNEIRRHEEVKIILHEGSEFHAEAILMQGSHRFEVPANHRLVLKSQSNGKFTTECLPIQFPTWHWNYSFDSHHHIKLKKVIAKDQAINT